MSGFKYSPVEKRTTTKIHLIVKKKNDGSNNTNSNDKKYEKMKMIMTAIIMEE